MLSLEERNDLRKKVLRGEDLTLDEAREVFTTLRAQTGAAMLDAADAPAKKTRKSAAKPTYTDEQLDADLAGLGLD